MKLYLTFVTKVRNSPNGGMEISPNWVLAVSSRETAIAVSLEKADKACPPDDGWTIVGNINPVIIEDHLIVEAYKIIETKI